MMILRLVRILTGFALASFAAAVTLVAFVYAPSETAGLTGARLSAAGYFAIVITPWVALCAALPAFISVMIAEARHIAGWTFYVLAGIGTAAVGFLVQYWTETRVGPGIFQAYALIAFLTAGLIGGLAYWVSSGRYIVPPAGSSKSP
jgi:hypothetical protein